MKWKQDLEFSLKFVDLDMTLREAESIINDHNILEEKEKLAKWNISNRLSLYATKRTISIHLIYVLPYKKNAKEHLIAIGERFQVSDNVKSGYLMKQLTENKYDNCGGAREFILRMVHA